MKYVLLVIALCFSFSCMAQIENPFYIGYPASYGDPEKINDSTYSWKINDTLIGIIGGNNHYYKLLSRGKLLEEGGLGYSCVDCPDRNGRCNEFYVSGKVKTTGFYLRGKPVGLWSRYYENGQLQEQYTLTLTKNKEGYKGYIYRAGSYQSFYENGQVKTEGLYIVGEYEAIDSFPRIDPITGETEMLGEKRTDIRSKPFGIWVYYNPDGTVERREDEEE